MLCVGTLFAGIILGWVARGALYEDPDTSITATDENTGTLATETETRPMPDVRGLSEADARQVLADAGYDAAIVMINNVPSVAAAGTVAAQQPVSGTANPSAITLSLPSPATMPDLGGKLLDEATQALAAMGAEPAVKRVYEASAKPGTILGTEPKSGDTLTVAPLLTVAASPGTAPLSSLQDGGSCRSISSGSADGIPITDGVSCSADSNSSTTYWILGRTLSRLKMTVGLDDSSEPSSRAKVTITVDGKALMDRELAYGESTNIDSDIAGALRLEVVVTSVSSSSSRGPAVVLANATVLGSSEAIDALEVNR